MEKLVGISENALKDKVGRTLFDSLKETSSLFNDEWKSTGTWSFSIDLFDDVVSVGSELISRYENEDFQEEFSISKEDWRSIYSNIYESKNQNKFKEIIQSAVG